MVVISYKVIRDFCMLKHEATDSLNNWYRVMETSDFGNFNEMRMIFNSVDAVGNDLYVFNIKGNHYRLVARIHFSVRTVYIKFVGTHNEYDQLNFKKL